MKIGFLVEEAITGSTIFEESLRNSSTKSCSFESFFLGVILMVLLHYQRIEN